MSKASDMRDDITRIIYMEKGCVPAEVWEANRHDSSMLFYFKIADALIAEGYNNVSPERVWDECLDSIEANELNTDQAREGNPYRPPKVEMGEPMEPMVTNTFIDFATRIDIDETVQSFGLDPKPWYHDTGFISSTVWHGDRTCKKNCQALFMPGINYSQKREDYGY